MPWTPADAKKHDKDADTAKKKRQWAHIANASKKRGDDDATAIRKASGVVDHVEIPSFLGAVTEAKSAEDFDWEMFLGQLRSLAKHGKLDLEPGKFKAILRPKGKELPRIVLSRGGLNGQMEVAWEEMGRNAAKKRLPYRKDPENSSVGERNAILKHVRNLIARNRSKFEHEDPMSFLNALNEGHKGQRGRGGAGRKLFIGHVPRGSKGTGTKATRREVRSIEKKTRQAGKKEIRRQMDDQVEVPSFLSAFTESTVTDDLSLFEKVQEQVRRGAMVRAGSPSGASRRRRPARPQKKKSLWSKIKGAARTVGSAAQKAFDAPPQYR